MQLDQRVLSRVAKRFAGKYSQSLTKKKLGQFVPVAGVAFGAGMNWHVIDRTGEAAYWGYRERFLREKQGEAVRPAATPSSAAEAIDAESDEPLTILPILQEEGVEIDDYDPGDGDNGRG